MPQDRWIDVDTAKKLLKNVCDFLETDPSGVADFRIESGKEAILMTLYTGEEKSANPAFFALNEKYKYRFRPVADAFAAREPLTLIPSEPEVWASSEVAPIFVYPLSSYLRFFRDLPSAKYLFILRRSDYRSGGQFSIKKAIADVSDRIGKNGLSLSDCVFWLSSEGDVFGEGFWDYISGVILRGRGYFVTHYGSGGPDLYAYYVQDYLEKLIRRGFLNKGAFIEELEMPNKPQIVSSKVSSIKSKFESVLVESESSEKSVRSFSGGKSGVSQALRYLDFSEAGHTHAFVAGPFVRIDDFPREYRGKIGLISCDENGNLIFEEPKAYGEPQPGNVETVKNVIKCSLLRNLSFEERCRLIGTSPTDLRDYFEKLLKLGIDTILDKIEEKLKH
jgi:hypothetical protein